MYQSMVAEKVAQMQAVSTFNYSCNFFNSKWTHLKDLLLFCRQEVTAFVFKVCKDKRMLFTPRLCLAFAISLDLDQLASGSQLIWICFRIATDKRGYPHNIFLFLDEYIHVCCGYSLEAPRRGASNEYPQHMYSLRNKKDISIFRMKKVPYLFLCALFVIKYLNLYQQPGSSNVVVRKSEVGMAS